MTATTRAAARTGAIVFWFCGFSGSGKSTIAAATVRRLNAAGTRVELLDGDAVRARQHRDLGFSAPDIIENNRLIAKLCVARRADCDVILVPVISPLEEGRQIARRVIGSGIYIVFCNSNVETVRQRDAKGLYARADRGEITDMIGYSAGAVPFEPPGDADLVLETGSESPASCCDRLYRFIAGMLRDRGTHSSTLQAE